MKTTAKFLATLFEPSELVCVSRDAYGTFLSGQYDVHPDSVFFSINPLHTSRADANVTCFRNILLEIDSLPLSAQREYLDGLKIPYTSVVYSGSKSMHFIISLDNPCSTKEEYDTLVKRLHKLASKVDPTSKNASRFSRFPGAKRIATGKVQELVFLGNRVSRTAFEALLPAIDPPKAYAVQPKGFYSTLVVDSMFYPDAVMSKIGIPSRNQFYFWLGQRLKEADTPPDNAHNIVYNSYKALKNKSDFPWSECAAAARVYE